MFHSNKEITHWRCQSRSLLGWAYQQRDSLPCWGPRKLARPTSIKFILASGNLLIFSHTAFSNARLGMGFWLKFYKVVAKMTAKKKPHAFYLNSYWGLYYTHRSIGIILQQRRLILQSWKIYGSKNSNAVG